MTGWNLKDRQCFDWPTVNIPYILTFASVIIINKFLVTFYVTFNYVVHVLSGLGSKGQMQPQMCEYRLAHWTYLNSSLNLTVQLSLIYVSQTADDIKAHLTIIIRSARAVVFQFSCCSWQVHRDNLRFFSFTLVMFALCDLDQRYNMFLLKCKQ